MTIQEVLAHDTEFRYMLLNRMKMDCVYFLTNGNGCTKYLWAGNAVEHIVYMKAIHNSFPEGKKPKWLTMAEINEYARKMGVVA